MAKDNTLLKETYINEIAFNHDTKDMMVKVDDETYEFQPVPIDVDTFAKKMKTLGLDIDEELTDMLNNNEVVLSLKIQNQPINITFTFANDELFAYEIKGNPFILKLLAKAWNQ